MIPSLGQLVGCAHQISKPTCMRAALELFPPLVRLIAPYETINKAYLISDFRFWSN